MGGGWRCSWVFLCVPWFCHQRVVGQGGETWMKRISFLILIPMMTVNPSWMRRREGRGSSMIEMWSWNNGFVADSSRQVATTGRRVTMIDCILIIELFQSSLLILNLLVYIYASNCVVVSSRDRVFVVRYISIDWLI